MNTSTQNEFGFFGKLPTLGDFIHQHLPQDFVNGWHAWLQQSMAEARSVLGNDFLPCYLNCPAWKFLISPGVCGQQAVAGLTIPSVDKVGRYFNFTLATALPPKVDPCTYAMSNPDGMTALENLALDILENDYSKQEIELKVRDVTLQFSNPAVTHQTVEEADDYIRVCQDQSLPFSRQSGALLTWLTHARLGNFSIWWQGQAGQTRSQTIACRGLPSSKVYVQLLAPGGQAEDVQAAQRSEPLDPVNQILAEEH